MGITVHGNIYVKGDQVNGTKIVYETKQPEPKKEEGEFTDFEEVVYEPEQESEIVQVTANKSSKFASFIPNDLDKNLVLQKLHNLIDGKRGVEAVKVLVGALEGGFITSIPSYKVVTDEFGKICNSSSFYELTKKQFFEREMNPIINYIKA